MIITIDVGNFIITLILLFLIAMMIYLGLWASCRTGDYYTCMKIRRLTKENKELRKELKS